MSWWKKFTDIDGTEHRYTDRTEKIITTLKNTSLIDFEYIYELEKASFEVYYFKEFNEKYISSIIAFGGKVDALGGIGAQIIYVNDFENKKLTRMTKQLLILMASQTSSYDAWIYIKPDFVNKDNIQKLVDLGFINSIVTTRHPYTSLINKDGCGLAMIYPYPGGNYRFCPKVYDGEQYSKTIISNSEAIREGKTFKVSIASIRYLFENFVECPTESSVSPSGQVLCCSGAPFTPHTHVEHYGGFLIDEEGIAYVDPFSLTRGVTHEVDTDYYSNIWFHTHTKYGAATANLSKYWPSSPDWNLMISCRDTNSIAMIFTPEGLFVYGITPEFRNFLDYANDPFYKRHVINGGAYMGDIVTLDQVYGKSPQSLAGTTNDDYVNFINNLTISRIATEYITLTPGAIVQPTTDIVNDFDLTTLNPFFVKFTPIERFFQQDSPGVYNNDDIDASEIFGPIHNPCTLPAAPAASAAPAAPDDMVIFTAQATLLVPT